MRVLVIGATGMLGHKLLQRWNERFEVFGTVRRPVDVAAYDGLFAKATIFPGVDAEEFDTVEAVVRRLSPDVIVNAAGVIKQLPSSKNVVRTLTVNSIFPHRLADVAASVGAYLVTVSTDCVFLGTKGSYKESDPADALDLYGRSKQLGEVDAENCLTVRTSIIGRELGSAHSLVDWFLANRGGSVKGFANAIYSGFPTIVFADIISDLIERKTRLSGLWHISSEPIDKFTLLTLINDAFRAKIRIERDDEFRIDRSLDSERFRRETGFKPLSWERMIADMASDPTSYAKWKNEGT